MNGVELHTFFASKVVDDKVKKNNKPILAIGGISFIFVFLLYFYLSYGLSNITSITLIQILPFILVIPVIYYLLNRIEIKGSYEMKVITKGDELVEVKISKGFFKPVPGSNYSYYRYMYCFYREDGCKIYTSSALYSIILNKDECNRFFFLMAKLKNIKVTDVYEIEYLSKSRKGKSKIIVTEDFFSSKESNELIITNKVKIGSIIHRADISRRELHLTMFSQI